MRSHTGPIVLSVVFVALAPGRAVVQDAQALHGAEAPANAVWVDSLNLSQAQIRRPRAQRGQPPPGPLTLSLGGIEYPHGLPLQVNADLVIDLKGGATRFAAMAGIDDERQAGQGSVTFDVWVDGRHAYDSGILRSGEPPRQVGVDLTGARQLILSIGDGGDTTRDDSAIWGGAMIVLAPGAQQPEIVALPPEPLPPIAPSRTAEPRINSPRVTGATPGRWFQFMIPASGDGPLKFGATNLPPGLRLNRGTGVITGSLKAPGRTVMSVTVTGPKGTATAPITIVGGADALAVTPPLGWNSWNVWGGIVDAAKVRAAADALVTSGLAAQGYTYVNIDDAWEGPRTADGEITSNEKFPDMKALADYVHSKGLKIGLYSSPGPRTCQQRFAGSYEHEAQDARTWAAWGFDYIKYDWCSYSDIEKDAARSPLPALQKPYVLMRGILDTLDRDMVYSLCQYRMGQRVGVGRPGRR